MTAMNDNDEIRVQIPLRALAVKKVDELAERMGVGRGRMAAMLLEAGIDDNEWMIRIVTSRFVKPMTDLVRQWSKPGGPKPKEA